MTHELEPCPFCGGSARVHRKSGISGTACRFNYYREYVECKGCGARSKDGKRPEAAGARWNRRLSSTKSEPVAVKALVAKWLDAPEGYGLRRERLLDDIANGNDIVPWLEAAAALSKGGAQ